MPLDPHNLQQFIVVLFTGLPRMLAAFTVLPLLSKQVLPGMVRNGVVVSLTLILIPMHMSLFPAEGLPVVTLIGLVLKEVFVGMCIGYLVAIAFWALESVGFFIDNQRGATMASSMNPLTGSQTSLLAIMFVQALTAIFFVSGGFLLFLGTLYQSYRIWPIYAFFPQLDMSTLELFIVQLDQLMLLTVLLSSPIIIPMFLSEFALALISRFAPQLNVFFLAMPIKSAIANLLLVIYLGFLLTYFADDLRHTGVFLTQLQDAWQ
jgi:type III secretion protein T